MTPPCLEQLLGTSATYQLMNCSKDDDEIGMQSKRDLLHSAHTIYVDVCLKFSCLRNPLLSS